MGIFLLARLSGSGKVVRLGAAVLGAGLSLLLIENPALNWLNVGLILIGIAAAALAAEIWLSVVLPTYFGLRTFLSAAWARLSRD
ncbi:MAG: hypothetical protein MEP57_07535 [Microvirga sp.]|nr:hypothetical protein [Microvirga sp.]